MADITLLPSAKVPLIYDGELTMTTEWYRFFWNIYGFTGTGVIPVNKGGTGLDTIGDHQLIIGNANNVFEPALLSSASIAITYPTGFINLELGTSGVTPGTYGSASQVGVFTVNAYGVLTAASNTSIGIDASQIVSGTLPVIRGGTGQSTYTDGQLLIGNSTGNTLTKATLTAGTGISVTNGAGSITIANTGVLSVSGTAPVVSSGGATPAISMAAANTTTNGYLTSTDWNTFNNKAPATSGSSILYGNGAGGFSNVTIGTGVSFAGGTLSATGSGGTVTSVAALTLGTTGTDLSSTVANSTTTPVITLNVPTASATNRGALSAADWTTFNSKAPGVTFTTNYIPYGQGTTTLNQSAGLQFDGTNFTTTGYATATSFRPSSSTVPTNGLYLPAANSVGLATNTTARFIIDASGNSLFNSATAFYNSTNRGVVELNGTSTSLFALKIGDTPQAYLFADATNTRLYSVTAGGAVLLGTNSAERMRIFSTGGVSIGNTTDPGATNLSVTGTGKFGTTVGVGAATPSTSGAGVTFPATQSASTDVNTLDDYEEGTFTPVVSGSTTAGAGTYTSQIGRYTKTGNRVFITITLAWTAHTGTGNFANITGLPFTSVNVAGSFASFSIYSNDLTLTASNTTQAIIGAAATSIVFRQVPVGGGAAAAIPLDTAVTTLTFSGHYETA